MTTITIKDIDNIGLDKAFFDRWASEVCQSLYASNIRRVHNSGQAVNGSSIGHYSTKPIYVNPKNSPVKFTPKGKGITKTRNKKVFHYYSETSEEGYTTKEKQSYQSNTGRTFKNGKPRHSRYFPGGYKQFRGSIGSTEAPVNLQLSGRLKEDFGFVHEGENWALGFFSSYGEKLHHGLEEKYNKQIWGVTSEDEAIIDEITERYLKQYA